jgi:hypothetical protein
MGTWTKIITSLASIFEILSRGAKAVQERLNKSRREKEIKANEEFDKEIDEKIEDNKIDDLNDDFGWKKKAKVEKVEETPETVKNDETEQEIKDLNDELGWTDITPPR